MGRMKHAPVLPEIKAVGARIERWRRSRRKLGPMPAELWHAAISLAKEHGVGPVARGLRVDHGGLKRRMDERGAAGATGAESEWPATFVVSTPVLTLTDSPVRIGHFGRGLRGWSRVPVE